MLARSGATSANPPYIPLKPAIPAAARVRTGPGADRVDPDAVRPEVGGEVADRRLERGLGDAHHVVVGDDLLGAVVGQRDDRRAAAEQRPRLARERDQRVGRDVERQREPVARRVDELALEVLALRVRQRVDEDVERVVGLAPAREDAPGSARRTGRRTARRTSSRSTSPAAGRAARSGSRPTRSRPRRPRRGAPGRSPRRSSGRWRRRR